MKKHPTIKPLTQEEEHIIIHKGTEAPFTNRYRDNTEIGNYYCRNCGILLYNSEQKFASHCGWPSFDDVMPGAIKRQDDKDQVRTEIVCNQCGGHLGHVFVGEHLTDANIRYCVNSTSLVFVAGDTTTKEIKSSNTYETAILGGGCFRCLEAPFQQLQGIIEIHPGYSGGKRPFPTYEQICAGVSDHIEVVKIIYDPALISYEMIVKVFFTLHDPTSLDKQGNDIGPQYRSIIFTTTAHQKEVADSLISTLTEQKLYKDPIVTEIRPLEKFRPAEGYHRDFYNQHTSKPYCRLVITPKIHKLQQEWKHLLKHHE